MAGCSPSDIQRGLKIAPQKIAERLPNRQTTTQGKNNLRKKRRVEVRASQGD